MGPIAHIAAGSFLGNGTLVGTQTGIHGATTAAATPASNPHPETGPEFPPLHGNLKSLPAWLRHIEFQLVFQTRRYTKTALYFTTPGRIKTAIFWEAPKGELALRASLQKNQGALRSAWQKLLAADEPMSLFLQSIGRGIGTIETSPCGDSATWTPLTEEERPWTQFQLKHHNFFIRQEITLSLHIPDGTTPLQWIAAFLESLRETLRV